MQVPLEDVPLLARALSLMDWPGRWFQRSLRAGGLLPACLVAYRRIAFADGRLRLTLDRHPHGTLTNEWNFAPVEGGLPLLRGQVILELKFRSAVPALFEELIRDLALSRSTVSKYRLCREAWGVMPACREVVQA